MLLNVAIEREHQLRLLGCMLLEQEVQLEETRSSRHPMMVLVERVKDLHVDLGNAQIVFSDQKGELKLEKVDGKKLLTAKDPQGKLLFSGPVETKDDLDKLPAEVRGRYDKLQTNDLPAVAPRADVDEDESGDEDNDNDDDQGEDETSESLV